MIGIDGCRGRWIAAEHTGDSWDVCRTESLDELEFDEAIIDVSVATPDEGKRRCGREAGCSLSPERHTSVFNCPVRKAVYADSYEEACDINESISG